MDYSYYTAETSVPVSEKHINQTKTQEQMWNTGKLEKKEKAKVLFEPHNSTMLKICLKKDKVAKGRRRRRISPYIVFAED